MLCVDANVTICNTFLYYVCVCVCVFIGQKHDFIPSDVTYCYGV